MPRTRRLANTFSLLSRFRSQREIPETRGTNKETGSSKSPVARPRAGDSPVSLAKWKGKMTQMFLSPEVDSLTTEPQRFISLQPPGGPNVSFAVICPGAWAD